MKNNFWLGVLLGLLLPLLAFLLTRYTALMGSLPTEKQGFLYIVAAGLNLLGVRFLYRQEIPFDKVAKGIIAVTFVAMLAFLYTQKISI